jgi:ABC-type multidrug transport system fused ATPase/permease subunit
LIKLLCRLYDPTAGAITLDGIDLRELDRAALRR